MKLLTLIFIFTVISFSNLFSSEPLAAYYLDEKWHFIDEDGKELFEPIKVTQYGGYSEGLIRVQMLYEDELRWLYLNTKGEVVLVPEADECTEFHEDRAIVIDLKAGERYYGFIDREGNQITEIVYTDITHFSEGMAFVRNKEERGYINKEGKLVVSMEETVGYDFSEKKAAISKKFGERVYRVAYMNTDGSMLTDFEYEEPREFTEGMCVVNQNAKFGYINAFGQLIIPYQYDIAKKFQEGLAFVGRYDARFSPKWGVINMRDELVQAMVYSDQRDYSESLAAVRKDGLWAFVNTSGAVEIPYNFKKAESFVNSLAFVVEKESSNIGFINKEAKMIISIPKGVKYVYDLRLKKRVL